MRATARKLLRCSFLLSPRGSLQSMPSLLRPIILNLHNDNNYIEHRMTKLNPIRFRPPLVWRIYDWTSGQTDEPTSFQTRKRKRVQTELQSSIRKRERLLGLPETGSSQIHPSVIITIEPQPWKFGYLSRHCIGDQIRYCVWRLKLEVSRHLSIVHLH